MGQQEREQAKVPEEVIAPARANQEPLLAEAIPPRPTQRREDEAPEVKPVAEVPRVAQPIEPAAAVERVAEPREID